MDELIRRLQDRLRHTPAVEMDACCIYSNDKGEVLPPRPPRPPVASEVVEGVERTLGFALPTCVRRLYAEVADGAYGPDWGIIRLRSPEGTDFRRWWEQPMSVEAWAEHYRQELAEEGPSSDWRVIPDRAIRFCEAGCNISYWLDCSTEAARLLQRPEQVRRRLHLRDDGGNSGALADRVAGQTLAGGAVSLRCLSAPR